MLNRRTLRIKAMQTLFSIKQGQEANYMIAKDELSEKFSRDMTSMEFQDIDLLQSNRKDAHELLQELIIQKIDKRNNYSDEVVLAVDDAIQAFENRNKTDIRDFKARMIGDVEKLNNYYISFIDLIFELREIAAADKKQNNDNFVNNLLIKRLLLNNSAEKAILDCQSGWRGNPVVKSWFREIIRSNKTYEEYLKHDNPGFKDHQKWLQYLIKNVLFDNSVIENHLEEQDIFWSENKAIIKSLILKTFKTMDEEDEEFEFQPISYNYDDDKTFFMRLFDEVISLDQEYKELISKRAVNWDIDRLAVTDRIILEMAVAELVFFPSIPIKVTINEYIEISKLYSTPKSKQFINGMLDVLADELKKNGTIKKSGRGLLDNK